MNCTDKEIAEAILNRDSSITVEFLYRKCYPLFKALYGNYETDCDDVVEFIHEIYMYLLTPGKSTAVCPLSTYRSEGSLFTWLKLVGRSYCYARYHKKQRMAVDTIDISDIYEGTLPSFSLDVSNINKADIKRLLTMMPNKRYSKLIWLRYVRQYTNEETAQVLGMSMPNYYNKHKLAKEQFLKIYSKEFRR